VAAEAGLMDEGVIKKLVASIKCGACGQHYKEDDINVIEHNEELWFLKVFCSSCRIKYLVAAIIQEGKKTEVITDLSEEELVKFRNGSMVSMDDVLDMHNYLKNFHGELPHSF
jgi:hypothetical protein